MKILNKHIDEDIEAVEDGSIRLIGHNITCSYKCEWNLVYKGTTPPGGFDPSEFDLTIYEVVAEIAAGKDDENAYEQKINGFFKGLQLTLNVKPVKF